MTYKNLYALLDYINYNVGERNIKLEVEVLNLCLNGKSENYNNILFWRFAQWDGALDYPELIEMFKMKDNIYSEKQVKIYEKFLSTMIDQFETPAREINENPYKLFNNDETHMEFKQKGKELSILLKKDAKALYDDLRALVGDAIFEEIRYDLNPSLGNYIAQLYNLMQNEVGNLFDKRIFVSACRLEKMEDIKLLINVISLAKHYDVVDDLRATILSDISSNKLGNLFNLYETLLYRNTNFSHINESLVTVENKDKEDYNLEWINNTKKMIKSISPTFDHEDDSIFDFSNLYIIIAGKEKFKNKESMLDEEKSSQYVLSHK